MLYVFTDLSFGSWPSLFCGRMAESILNRPSTIGDSSRRHSILRDCTQLGMLVLVGTNTDLRRFRLPSWTTIHRILLSSREHSSDSDSAVRNSAVLSGTSQAIVLSSLPSRGPVPVCVGAHQLSYARSTTPADSGNILLDQGDRNPCYSKVKRD